MTPRSATEPLGGLSPEELLLALDAAHAGTFRVDLRTRRLRWSPSLSRLYGLRPDEAPETFEDLRRLVHPDDRDRLTRAVRDAVEEGVPYSVDFRVLWPDGSVHWLQGAGRRLDDEEGRPHLRGVRARRMTGERAAEASSDEIHALVDAVYATAPVGLAFIDTEMRYVRINEALAAINGRDVSEPLGRTVREVLDDPLRTRVEARIREARDTGRVITEDDVSPGVDGGGAAPARRAPYAVTYYPVVRAEGAWG